MPFFIVKNDITKMKVDAIVNAANRYLLGGGGVDCAIHRAAGQKLLEECRTLGGCEAGEAKLTLGYDLPAKYVIHTVGPIWHNGLYSEKEILYSCYENSLYLARSKGVESIAFPLISAGAYGYPRDKAISVAEKAIKDFLAENDMTVYLVLFDGSYAFSKKRFDELRDYIGDRYAEEHKESISTLYRRKFRAKQRAALDLCTNAEPSFGNSSASVDIMPEMCDTEALIDYSGISKKIDEMLDESFSEMLLRKIDERGMTDSACYKKANIDRKLFSKIRSYRLYRPSKATAIAFAVALELDLHETANMLKKAGYALSHSNKFDLIIEYFIERGIYDVYEINEALFAFDQQLLGA